MVARLGPNAAGCFRLRVLLSFGFFLKVGQTVAGVLHSNVYVKMYDSRMEDQGQLVMQIL